MDMLKEMKEELNVYSAIIKRKKEQNRIEMKFTFLMLYLICFAGILGAIFLTESFAHAISALFVISMPLIGAITIHLVYRSNYHS